MKNIPKLSEGEIHTFLIAAGCTYDIKTKKYYSKDTGITINKTLCAKKTFYDIFYRGVRFGEEQAKKEIQRALGLN